jgi:hypothetical protein
MTTPAPISKKELKTSIAVIGLVIGTISFGSLLLFTPYWFVWPIIVVCTLVAVGYFSASKYNYQCPACKVEFKITALQDFFAPHGISKGPKGELYEWKLLKCPQCGKREKCFRVGQTSQVQAKPVEA